MTDEEALDLLNRGRFHFHLGLKGRISTLERIELIYLPYYFFDLILSEESVERNVRLAVDGLLGNNVLFVGRDVTFNPAGTRPGCDFELPPTAAEATAVTEYRWLLLEHGLRSRRSVRIREISSVHEVHYPFWVGYFRKRRSYDFRVLDGVSGTVQGVKMRKVMLHALRQNA